MRTLGLLLLAVWCASAVAHAQFGGREGDAVIYVVSAKGQPDFQVAPSNTVNTQTGFVIEKPEDVPMEPFGPDFPSEFRRKMHGDTGDVFNMILQHQGDQSPHQVLQDTVKVFLYHGILRLLPAGEAPTDTTGGLFVPFPSGIDFGPNTQLFDNAIYLMWTPSAIFPVAQKADPNFRSSVTPPGFSSSVAYLLSLGTFAGIVRWVGLNQQFPGVGWSQGIDTRLIERDLQYGTKIQLLRLRPGRSTPLFRINANTHLFVLTGNVTLTPANGTPTVMNPSTYSFVPPGYAIRLSNPLGYDGPGAQ
jgi:hypothetical protein